MARKKNKQMGAVSKEPIAGQESLAKTSTLSPGDAACGGGDLAVDRLPKTNQLLPVGAASAQSMHTCCLLCHRERKEWGTSPANGLPGSGVVPALSQALLGEEQAGRKVPDAMPSLSQSLLGEVPLWICQSCRKSVEDEERRAAQEQALAVSLSHSSCKTQSCGNGYPDHGSSVDWDPSSFLSAHKLSGLWNSAHTNGGAHCNHTAAAHTQQGGTAGLACHEKRPSHEAPGKAAKPAGTKVCPYSHPSSQNSSGAAPGSPLSTSSDLCKTTPKHFKTMCRRPTPPGEAFHSSEHHQHSDLAVPPNSPTGLSSQHSSLLPPKQSPSQHVHATSPGSGSATHAPFSPLVPNLHVPVSKIAAGPDSPASLHKPGACKNSHVPPPNTPHAKMAASPTGCSHPCNGHSNGTGASPSVAHLPSGGCRDQACKGHKQANGMTCHPPCELEEGLCEDEDSSSERSSCASSSTNQKDGKYCDCCYCEFFGHNAPPAAPTSRNYAEIREKLRSRLTRRKEEVPQQPDSDPAEPSAIDHRDVNELLDFINSNEPKPVNSAKAAKRARHKQKKKEMEKVQQCSVEPPRPDLCSSPPGQQAVGAVTGESGRLLEWPQLELERVNSFLTSRLEEIKNTIKDSIRASFSMYDLNLDVNDFPKKAATLESNRLLSHLNGTSELQQIDLDLSPLTLGSLKNHLVNSREELGSADSPAASDVRRLNATPSLSKLIRVRSPERNGSANTGTSPAPPPLGTTTATKEECPDPKDTAAAGAGNGKQRKGKKQQQQQQQSKTPKPEPQKTKETQARVSGSGSSSKAASKHSAKALPVVVEPHKGQAVQGRRPEESKGNRQGQNGGFDAGGCRQLERNSGGPQDMKSGPRVELEPETRAHTPASTGSQQPKGKSKKNKNKADKSSSSVDDVFLPKDLDGTEMDEIDREVEYFKRFCLDSAKQTRQKVAVNWSNFSLKKVHSNAAQ
ncbi:protein FAM193B-like isoform X1 [Acipenser oxyrinchus oxyrinchus]|uniref:Protein FAM193B-like isoform X1 n=1 Tax=Acipenser oxyrinchus oxyrinchus TaxID=40147 RepID=A0AAD8FZW3_ACIOX|nr:protein FAM193B-like isoform X1 [Acipenser oxyrinchus oxyrinchus]